MTPSQKVDSGMGIPCLVEAVENLKVNSFKVSLPDVGILYSVVVV